MDSCFRCSSVWFWVWTYGVNSSLISNNYLCLHCDGRKGIFLSWPLRQKLIVENIGSSFWHQRTPGHIQGQRQRSFTFSGLQGLWRLGSKSSLVCPLHFQHQIRSFITLNYLWVGNTVDLTFLWGSIVQKQMKYFYTRVMHARHNLVVSVVMSSHFALS